MSTPLGSDAANPGLSPGDTVVVHSYCHSKQQVNGQSGNLSLSMATLPRGHTAWLGELQSHCTSMIMTIAARAYSSVRGNNAHLICS